MDNQIGFLRLPQVLEIIPVSKSKWWAGVKKLEYPASVKLGPRTTAWKRSDILKLADDLSKGKKK
ncbi:MAG: hypothetical protein FD159_912 [Syntrophaceae bacterium]|nr:MAG: hypothetical protein FD159_912 [Syntrophaceae bacterium]